MAPTCPSAPLSEFLTRLRGKANFDRIPLFGSFELTHRCTFRCQHCYLGDQHSICRHRNDELGTDEVVSLIDQFIEAGTLFLTLTGGDPLLRNDFAEIYAHAVRCGLIVSVFCNGSLIDDSIISLWKQYPPRAVELTMYGATASTFEEVTQTTGSYDLFHQGLTRLRQNNISYRLKTMLLTINRHELAEMEAIAEDLDVHFRYDAMVSPCMPYDDNHGRSNMSPSSHTETTEFAFQELFPASKAQPRQRHRITSSMLAPLSLRLSADEIVTINLANEKRRRPYLAYKEKSLPSEDDRLFLCDAGRSGFHVTPYGQLMPCIASIEPVCDLRRHDFKHGWGGPLARLGKLEISEENICHRCELRTRCDACPSLFALETGDYLTPSSSLCKITRLRSAKLRQKNNNEESLC